MLIIKSSLVRPLLVDHYDHYWYPEPPTRITATRDRTNTRSANLIWMLSTFRMTEVGRGGRTTGVVLTTHSGTEKKHRARRLQKDGQ
jgi:hypothetical protein